MMYLLRFESGGKTWIKFAGCYEEPALAWAHLSRLTLACMTENGLEGGAQTVAPLALW